MKPATPPDLDALAVAKRLAVAAEAAMCEQLLDYEAHGRELAGLEREPLRRMMARSSVTSEIAAAGNWSEGQAASRLHAARTVRSRTPQVWAAFIEGVIDMPMVREISHAVDALHEVESVARLDQTVVAYAVAHTSAELKRWLRRFIERVEADHAVARAEEQRKNRHVRITHADDGMSWISAYVPSAAAGAIERRLYKQARAITGDNRSIAQREADLFVSWATSSEDGSPAPHAEIAVVVDADVLAGARTGFAESSDGAWSVPADWIKQIAEHGDPVWYRLTREPRTQDILSVEYKGRFAPKLLRKALEFTYQTCAAPGCLIPAWKCEIDHQIPWPRGSTIGSNTQPLSKTHHGQKGHGLVPRIAAA